MVVPEGILMGRMGPRGGNVLVEEHSGDEHSTGIAPTLTAVIAVDRGARGRRLRQRQWGPGHRRVGADDVGGDEPVTRSNPPKVGIGRDNSAPSQYRPQDKVKAGDKTFSSPRERLTHSHRALRRAPLWTYR